MEDPLLQLRLNYSDPNKHAYHGGIEEVVYKRIWTIKLA